MTVLVIGGGCGGLSFITALRKLDPAVEIVLVEPKDFCELLWASYRSPFDEQIAENSTFPLDEYCEEKSVRHLRTKVIRMTTNEAELEDGTIINFDSAVVSVGANIPWSGSGNGLPVGYDGSREERLKIMKEQGGRLLNAKKVVIVGGGLIGVELAGDVAGYGKKEKKGVEVTLVHSGDRLMPEISAGASKMAAAKLKKLGVKVILNERGVEKDGKVVLERSQEVLEADEIVTVVGLSANNSFVKIDGACTEKGLLNTDDYFRLNGSDGKVFAFGDCCTTLRNSAYALMQNGGIVAHNVKSALDGKTDDVSLKKMDPGIVVNMVTIGPYDGVAQLPWFYTQYLLPRFKNKTMMIASSKPQLGVK